MLRYESVFRFDNALRISVELDFIRYYLWHIKKFTYQTIPFFLPKYNGHVSVLLPNIHGDITFAQKYNGQKVSFEYNPEDIYCGGSYFIGFYLRVKCEAAQRIKEENGIIENNFHGYHLTICSDKWRKTKPN